MAAIGTGSNAGSKPSTLMRTANQLAVLPRQHFYDLARSLVALHDAERQNFLTLPELKGINQRRLYYLLTVGRFVDHCAIGKADAERVGWTKLRIVASYAQDHPNASHGEIAAWMDLANRLTAHELPSALGVEEPSITKDRALLLRLSPSDYNVVEAALLSYGASRRGRGLKGKAAALVAMAQAAVGLN